MRLSLPNTLLALTLSFSPVSSLADTPKDTAPPVDPCTVKSHLGSFYDLRSLSVQVPIEGVKPGKNAPTENWHAKGHDYHDGNANFTLNICEPLIGEVEDVIGVEKDLWRNVSAVYKVGSKTYSIGSNSSTLHLRGRRLVLEYTNGSPCDESSSSDSSEDEKRSLSTLSTKRRKSTIISFHCDKDPLSTIPTSSLTYVGSSPDECSYHFEVLSPAACLTSAPSTSGGVGPGAVFFIIGIVAILVYFLGGVFYQRNVAHARGWKQLPNYSMWAGIGGFIKVSGFSSRRGGTRSVRDGILPTMEVRPGSGVGNGYVSGGKKWKGHGYNSRSSWDSKHQN